jgi:hypothetical protein
MRTTMKRRSRKRGEGCWKKAKKETRRKLFTCFSKYHSTKWYGRTEVPSTPKFDTR